MTPEGFKVLEKNVWNIELEAVDSLEILLDKPMTVDEALECFKYENYKLITATEITTKVKRIY